MKCFAPNTSFFLHYSLFFVVCVSLIILDADGATVYNYVTAAGEVGSGTPSAASGRHFSPLAPRGNHQQNNGLLEQSPLAPRGNHQQNNGLLEQFPLAPRGNHQQNSGLLEEEQTPHRNNHSSVVLVSYKARRGDGSVDFREKDLAIDIRLKLSKSDKNIAVLHIVCGSKTGLVYPSLSTVKMLQTEFGSRLVVVVDACQLRCRMNTVSKYTNM